MAEQADSLEGRSIADEYAARERHVRSAAKWLIGVVGAVAGAFLARIGVADIGGIWRSDSATAAVSAGATFVGVAAVGGILLLGARVLTSPLISLADVVEREVIALQKAVAEAGHESKPTRGVEEYDNLLASLNQRWRILVSGEADRAHDLYQEMGSGLSPPPRVAEDARRVTSFASYWEVRRRFGTLWKAMVFLTPIFLASALTLSWAVATSEPGEPSVTQPIPVKVILGELNEDARSSLGLGSGCERTVLRGAAIGGDLAEPEVVTRPYLKGGCNGARFVATEEKALVLPLSGARAQVGRPDRVPTPP